MPASRRGSTPTVLFVAESETWQGSDQYKILTAVRPSASRETEVRRLRDYIAKRGGILNPCKIGYRVARYVRNEDPESSIDMHMQTLTSAEG